MSINSSALRQAGVNALKAGHLSEAITDLQLALQADPDSPETCTYLGAAYSQAGDFLNASRAFGHAAELQPNSGRARFNLGKCLEMSGDHAAARFCYEKAILLDPTYTQAKEALDRLPSAEMNVAVLSAPSHKIHLHGAHATNDTDEAPTEQEHEFTQAE